MPITEITRRGIIDALMAGGHDWAGRLMGHRGRRRASPFAEYVSGTRLRLSRSAAALGSAVATTLSSPGSLRIFWQLAPDLLHLKVGVGPDFPCIVAAEPAKAWHGVVFLANAKTMEMEVRPVEADLQDDVKIDEGAVGSYEKAPPEHRAQYGVTQHSCHRPARRDPQIAYRRTWLKLIAWSAAEGLVLETLPADRAAEFSPSAPQ
jgi:hypothetical protein